jgi:hypothetical protein
MRAPLLALLMTACSSAPDGMPPRQVTQLWPENHRLYVADSRQGVVRAFSTYEDPRAAAEGRALGRRAVLDMKLDTARGQLWVLGTDAVYLHDAVSMILLHRYPVVGSVTAQSRLSVGDLGTVSVVSAAAINDKRASGL